MLKIIVMPPSRIFNLMMYVTTPHGQLPVLKLDNKENGMLYSVTIYATTATCIPASPKTVSKRYITIQVF
jgi:hypothetical protein